MPSIDPRVTHGCVLMCFLGTQMLLIVRMLAQACMDMIEDMLVSSPETKVGFLSKQL